MASTVRDKPYISVDVDSLAPFTNSKFVTARGVELMKTTWEPVGVEVPKGQIILCHGYGDRVSDNEQPMLVADKFARAGYKVDGLDMEGHGQSPGVRVYIKSFNNYIADVVQLRNDVAKDNEARLAAARAARAAAGPVDSKAEEEAVELPPLPERVPCFLHGESMGGAVAMLTAHEHGELFDGAVLVAPMAAVDEQLMPPACIVSILTCFSKCCPTAACVPGPNVVPLAFKDKRKTDRVMKLDPYFFNKQPRLGSAVQLLEATQRCQAAIPVFKMPFVVLHGLADQVTKPELSARLHEGAASTDKTFLRYEDAWHALMWESDVAREHILMDQLDWLDTRCGGSQTANEVITRTVEFLASPVEDRIAAKEVAAKEAEDLPAATGAGGAAGAAHSAAGEAKEGDVNVEVQQ